MNIFAADKRWTSGLGDLGPILTGILGIIGPILTVGLLGLFLYTLIKNVITLKNPDISDEEKAKAKKNLFTWGISIGITAFGSLIVTVLFYSLGKSAQTISGGGSGSTASTTNPSLMVHLIYAQIKNGLGDLMTLRP